jgi:hypothetical protein
MLGDFVGLVSHFWLSVYGEDGVIPVVLSNDGHGFGLIIWPSVEWFTEDYIYTWKALSVW